MRIKVLCLVFAMILTMIVPAQANTIFQQDNILTEEYYGKYVISLKKGDYWDEVGSLNFGKNQIRQAIDLGEYLKDDNLIVKLEQEGGGSAYLDAVLLDGSAAFKVSNNNEKVLNKLSKEDLDITPVDEKEIILEFATFGNGILTVVGRIEPVVISKEPLQFPAANNYKTKDEVQDFYNYTLDSNLKTIYVDGVLDEVIGMEPFVKEYRVPGSGHPAGDIYFWVTNDNDNLYVTMDVTPDNTFDGDKDYAKVYIKTMDDIKEFRVSVPETTWGNTAFTYTDRVGYEHKVYEFVIPISEANVTNEKNLKLAFVIYGTVAMPQEFFTPDLAYDAYRDVYVCVYEGTNDYSEITENRIWADIINSDGTVLNEHPIMISGWQYKESFTPSITYDFLNDNFMVVWCNGFSNTKIYGKVFELNEFDYDDNDDEDLCISFISEDFRITSNEDIDGDEWIAYEEYEPEVTFNRNYEEGELNGHYFVVWSQRVNDNPANLSLTKDDIYGRFVSVDGELKGENGFVICKEPGRQVEPSICYSFGNEVFIVSWLSEHDDMNAIYARIIGEDGTLGDGIESIDGNVRNPSISVNEGYDTFLLTWIDNKQVKGAYLFYDGSSLELSEDETSRIFNISSEEFDSEYPIAIYGKESILCIWNSINENIGYPESIINLRYINQYEPFGSIFETSEPELTENYEIDKSLDIASNYLNEAQRNERFLVAYINEGRNDISYRIIGEPPAFEPYIKFDKDEYDIDLNANNTTQAEVFHFEYEDQGNGNNITNSEYIHYKSNDDSVATISETGLITGLTNGITTIEAVYYEPQYKAMLLEEYNELPYGALHAVATIIVTKTEPKEPSLTFEPNTINQYVGDKFSVKINYFNGLTTTDVINDVSITIDNPSIVTSTAIKGQFVCTAVGETILRTTHAGLEATATIKVREKTVSTGGGSSPVKTPIGEILVDKKVIKTLYKEDIKVKDNIYTLTAEKKGNNAKLWLDSSFYKELATEYPNRILNFVWDRGTYNLPLSCDEVLDEIDNSAKKINILLEKVEDKKIKDAAKLSASNMGAEIVSDLIDFCVFVEKSNKNIEINSLDFYAEKTINKLNDIDEYISTAMKFVEDKEILTFAPSVFDRDLATIKYRGNGIFTIIENPQTFNDIGSHWAKINIEKLASRNIAFGRQNKMFAPDDFVTRAEFAVMITRALGITEEEGTNNFKDVSNEWFAEDISTAFEAGLIKGRNDGNFYPDEKIQRKDMAVMINNALKFADNEVKISDVEKVLSIFNDCNLIDDYAKDSTAVCANASIIMGRDTQDFDPNENATRAEASAIIERMLRYLNFMN